LCKGQRHNKWPFLVVRLTLIFSAVVDLGREGHKICLSKLARIAQREKKRHGW